MDVNENVIKKIIQLVVDDGPGDDGEARTANKNFSGLKPGAASADCLKFAQAVEGLLNKTVQSRCVVATTEVSAADAADAA